MNSKVTLGTFAVGVLLSALVNAFGQPVITKQPADRTASLFADTSFNVTVTGDVPLSYQWRLDGADLVAATNALLRVTNVQRTNLGQFTVIVSNSSGSVTSQVATLTITPFNSIYCFGFSWTDTHNCSWDPAKYWKNHACNGPMWPELLSTNLGLSYVAANNYAHCGATAADIRDQTINYPAPKQPQLSLYCLWTGSPGDTPEDSLRALTNDIFGNQLLQSEVAKYSNAVNRLYSKGARTILIEVGGDPSTSPPLPDFPNDSALQFKWGQYVARLHDGLYAAFQALSAARADLRILSYKNAPKVDDVIVHAAQHGFSVARIDALEDPALTDKSFTGPGADYVFWDCCHGTSKLHQLITQWHTEALLDSSPERLQASLVDGILKIQMNRLQIGRDYSLQKSVDLLSWQDISSFTAAVGTNLWANPGSDTPTGYFRLAWKH